MKKQELKTVRKLIAAANEGTTYEIKMTEAVSAWWSEFGHHYQMLLNKFTSPAARREAKRLRVEKPDLAQVWLDAMTV